MRTSIPLKSVTIVFENLIEATIDAKDLDGFYFDIGDTSYMMMREGFDIKMWIKTMGMQIKNTGNKKLVSLTGDTMKQDLFTYIEEYGVIEQVVLNYEIQSKTFYIDDSTKQQVNRKEDGLNIFVQ